MCRLFLKNGSACLDSKYEEILKIQVTIWSY